MPQQAHKMLVSSTEEEFVLFVCVQVTGTKAQYEIGLSKTPGEEHSEGK